MVVSANYTYTAVNYDLLMDSTAISSSLMKLLEAIGTNEPVEKIEPLADNLIGIVSSACEMAKELEYVRAFRAEHHVQPHTKDSTPLQSRIDGIQKELDLIISS